MTTGPGDVICAWFRVLQLAFLYRVEHNVRTLFSHGHNRLENTGENQCKEVGPPGTT
jgi:hypothetical protein